MAVTMARDDKLKGNQWQYIYLGCGKINEMWNKYGEKKWERSVATHTIDKKKKSADPQLCHLLKWVDLISTTELCNWYSVDYFKW